MATSQAQSAAGPDPARMAAGTSSHMDWGAVIAGAALAAAVALVLLTFGAAIGLSLVSPFEGQGAPDPVFAIALALWVLWVIVSSFAAGGYLAGRLRRRVWDATAHEVEVRDGAHGLTVWSLGILLSAMLAAAGVSGMLRGGAQAAGAVASAAAGETGGPFGYVVDSLFRSPDAQAAVAATEAERGEVGRILARGIASGDIADADKTYVARLVATATGLEQAGAEQRVNEVLGNARQAAETARKVGIWTAFLTAAALLCGAAGAWFGASAGGRHRDEGIDFSRLTRWR